MAAALKGQRRALPEDLENVEFETSEDVEVTPTFDGMGLREVSYSCSRLGVLSCNLNELGGLQTYLTTLPP